MKLGNKTEKPKYNSIKNFDAKKSAKKSVDGRAYETEDSENDKYGFSHLKSLGIMCGAFNSWRKGEKYTDEPILEAADFEEEINIVMLKFMRYKAPIRE